MATWIDGQNGNRASVEYWGSEDEAKKALATLGSDCSGCSDCSDCYDCSRCSGCSGCSGCSDCSDCYGCPGCSGCSGCYGCSDCSRCSRCYDCYDCSGCYGCSGCSDCSDCSGCYGCYDCSDEKDMAPQPIVGGGGLGDIPIIADIHKKVFQAASQPRALNMGNWHTCDTTHCRAGWVVHLAGEPGYALEKKTSPVFAAMQIYRASGYEISPVRFFDDNPKALEDMRRLAESENVNP